MINVSWVSFFSADMANLIFLFSFPCEGGGEFEDKRPRKTLMILT